MDKKALRHEMSQKKKAMTPQVMTTDSPTGMPPKMGIVNAVRLFNSSTSLSRIPSKEPPSCS